MTQKLKETDSVDRCLSMGRRSLRMFAQNKKAEDLITNIKGSMAACKLKKGELETAWEQADDCFDEWCFQDGNLDDAIRNTGNDCTKYDRENPGANLFTTLFPKGTSEVIRENRSVEPDVVDKIATKIEHLGEEHPIYPHAAKLHEQAALTREKEKLYNEANAVISKFEAELEMLKLALIKNYNDNILEATKRFGEAYASRLFPRIRNNSKEKETSAQPPAAVSA